MKNSLLITLILLLLFPAIMPWLPHGAVHALHESQAKHHAFQNHGHGHSEHNHGTESTEVAHHPIHLDAITYFKDYLHVDLKNPQKILLEDSSFDLDNRDYTHAEVVALVPRYDVVSTQKGVPPDKRKTISATPPLYLSTQRLRI